MLGAILLIIAIALGVAGWLIPSTACVVIAVIVGIVALLALGVKPDDIGDIFD